MSDSLSLGGGRHHFFEATSLSIALSSIASANSFFSLALKVALLIPCLRQTSAVFASAS
jgi:hypothetical protein